RYVLSFFFLPITYRRPFAGALASLSCSTPPPMATFHQDYVFYIGKDGRIHCIYYRDHRSLRDSDESDQESDDEKSKGTSATVPGTGDDDGDTNEEGEEGLTEEQRKLGIQHHNTKGSSIPAQQYWGYFSASEMSKAPTDLPPVTHMTCH